MNGHSFASNPFGLGRNTVDRDDPWGDRHIKKLPPLPKQPKPVRRVSELPQKPHIPVIGDSTSGKSTFIYTASVGRYPNDAGFTLNLKTAESVHSTIGLVQLLDTVNTTERVAGAPSWSSVVLLPTIGDAYRLSCYAADKCRAVIIVCSLVDPNSLDHVISRWGPEVLRRFASPAAVAAVARTNAAAAAAADNNSPSADSADAPADEKRNASAAASSAAGGGAVRWRPPILILATHSDQYRNRMSLPVASTAASNSAVAPAPAAPLMFRLVGSSGQDSATAAKDASSPDTENSAADNAPDGTLMLTGGGTHPSDGGSDDTGSGDDTTGSTPKPAASPVSAARISRSLPRTDSASALVLPPTTGGVFEGGAVTDEPPAQTLNEAPVLATTFADSIPTSDFLLEANGQAWAAAVTRLFSQFEYSDQLIYAECDTHDLQTVRTVMDGLLQQSEIRPADDDLSPVRKSSTSGGGGGGGGGGGAASPSASGITIEPNNY